MDKLENRKSAFGGHYPDSEPADWTEYEGIGWVHRIESSMFHAQYFQCQISDKWFSRRLSVSSSRGAACIDVAKEMGWMECDYTERWWPKEQMVSARDRVGVGIMASRAAIRDHFFKCDFTGEFYPIDARIFVKSKKYNAVNINSVRHGKTFGKCANCGYWFDKEMLEKREGYGDPWCNPCWNKLIARNLIFKHDHNVYPDPIVVQKTRLGHSYDRKGVLVSTGKKTTYSDFRLWGLEIETEMSLQGCIDDGITRHNMAREVLDCLGKDYIIIKEDGTLLENGHYANNRRDGKPNKDTGPMYAGFEIVTAPCDRETHFDRIPRLLNVPHYRHLRAWDTETCGFHVHVTRDALSYLQIHRMLQFVNSDKNTLFIQKVAGRGSETFCKYIPKDVEDALRVDERNDENRRQAINLCNERTIEFRIFRGTINPKHILRNLEFCEAICDFTAPCARSLKEMNDYRNLISFVNSNRKTWPLLASWFALHKMISADLTKKILRPKEVPLKKKKGRVVMKTVMEEIPIDRSKFTLKPDVDEPEIKVAGKLALA